jgi:hypothetical protein
MPVSTSTSDAVAHSDRFAAAIARFDSANSEDPHTELHNGSEQPCALLYAQRMSSRLVRFAPQASEALRLAARCQHIRRWTIPRSDYPQGREGYLLWRRSLADFHAETAAGILRQVGYDDSVIERVRSLLRKQNLKRDADMQCLEDVICLVFLEYYLDDFAGRHEDDKLVKILRRTWNKMSEQGHQAALTLQLPEHVQQLIGKALQQEN